MSDRQFRRQLYVTIAVLLVTLAGLSRFLEFVEDRPGTVLHDPVLQSFSPIDLTWLTFALIYIGLVAGLATLLRTPRIFLVTVQSYVLMVAVRIIMMYAFPLNPPEGLIPLKDPFVQYFGSGRPPTKDLFFSGHTATLFLLFLTAQTKGMKALFFTCAVTVAVAVILQHVHYMVDVLVAPFVSYGVLRIVQHLHRRSTLRIIRRDRYAARRSGTASLLLLLLLPAVSTAQPARRVDGPVSSGLDRTVQGDALLPGGLRISNLDWRTTGNAEPYCEISGKHDWSLRHREVAPLTARKTILLSIAPSNSDGKR